MQFLMKLRPQLESVKADILSRSSFVNLEAVFTKLLGEEIRLENLYGGAL